MVNQLGHGCKTIVVFFVVLLFSYTKEEFSSSNTFNNGYNLLGGEKYVALYIKLTILHINFVSPLFWMRTDRRKSEINTDLNFLYNGATVFNYPWYDTTSGHHTSGEWPKSCESIHLLIFLTNSVQKRGFSCKLLKKRTQCF